MRVVTALREPEAGSSSLVVACLFFVFVTFVKQRFSVSASPNVCVCRDITRDIEQAARMGIWIF
jgi:thiosulfate reductase cytochrome b subunit